MGYFEISQAVKPQILADSSMLTMARRCFAAEVEPFRAGGTVNLFYVGRLASGLHVALRAYKPEVEEGRRDLEVQMQFMENYCQNAEELHSQGTPVPGFCVAVVCRQFAGILTEDLTANDTVPYEHYPDFDYAWVGAERKKVFVDIDALFKHRTFIELKYFLEQHLVKL